MLLNFALRFHQRLHNTNRYTDAFILGYAAEEIEHAGSDAYNYQGVGHPHRHVNIQKGEVVLDLGSGLGIDSLIASDKVGGPELGGGVVGIDISKQEVAHAQKR